jgi:hypothetical protein
MGKPEAEARATAGGNGGMLSKDLKKSREIVGEI